MLESKYPYLQPCDLGDRLKIVDQYSNPAIQRTRRPEKTERIRAILLAQPFNDLTPVKFEHESIRQRDKRSSGSVAES